MGSQECDVAVVLSSYEEGPSLSRTIDSLLAASWTPSEIVVVDDGSTDGSCDQLWPTCVRVVRQMHLGIAAARTLGARMAKGRSLVFLDAHCAMENDWLRSLLQVCVDNPRAIVGPAIRDANDTRFVGCGAEIIDAKFSYRWSAVGSTRVTEVGLIPGGCMAVEREHFLRMGGFGPFKGFGLEDVELALRWWRAGFPILGTSESIVHHVFRTRSPYRPEERQWLQNIMWTALRHLQGSRLRSCIIECSQFAEFPAAIATVLSEGSVPLPTSLGSVLERPIDEYFERWAPNAFD